MQTRLQISLIIAVMVALCMSAVPSIAEQPAAISPSALAFSLPIADTGASLQVSVSTDELAWLTREPTESVAECEPAMLVAESGEPSLTGGLAADFDMPFFSVAGLIRGAVSQ